MAKTGELFLKLLRPGPDSMTVKAEFALRPGALTPRTTWTPSLIWRERSERLVRLNYEPALMALDHVLEVGIFMSRREQEPAIPPANTRIVREAHREPFGTGTHATFAQKFDLVAAASKRVDHLTGELLVFCLPPRSLFRGIRHVAGHLCEITAPKRGRGSSLRSLSSQASPARSQGSSLISTVTASNDGTVPVVARRLGAEAHLMSSAEANTATRAMA